MTANAQQQLLQHKYEAERKFVACVFVQPADCIRDCGWLKPEQFSMQVYGEFWRGILAGEEPTKAAIDAKCYTEILGAYQDVITTMHYASYAEAIQEDEYYIDVVMGSTEAVSKASERDMSGVAQVLGRMTAGTVSNSLKTYDSVDVAMKTAEMIAGGDLSVKTGITVLDKYLGGFGRKTLTIIGARPSMGKTTLAGTILRSAAQSGKKTLLISLEESKEILWAKWVSGACGLDYVKIQDNEGSPEEMEFYSQKSAEMMSAYGDKLVFIDDAKLDSAGIYSVVARIRPDIFVVDHSRLVKDKNPNEVKRMGTITQSGKEIAKQLDCVGIYLQQLNRGTETRDNKRPQMSDLRDSGEIEENADYILFMYREDYYEQDQTPKRISETELIVAKARSTKRNKLIYLRYAPAEYWFFSPGEENAYFQDVQGRE